MNLLRLALFLLPLLTGLDVRGQASPARSRIAALTTDAQVLDLVRPLGWEYAELVLGDSVGAAYRPYAGTRLRWRGESWHRADFDGNGWPDLLVVGRRRDVPFVFCVLDSGQNRLRAVRNFYRAGEQRHPTAQVVPRRGQDLLQFTTYARRRNASGGLTGRRTQLLAYRGQGFVPYERRPTAHRIRAIQYTSRLVYHERRETTVELDSTGLLRLTYRHGALGDTASTAVHATRKLAAAEVREIQDLLNYVRFAACAPAYTTGYNHRPVVVLRVRYEQDEKVIDDSSGGTLGLAQVYSWLESWAKPLKTQ
ncbi:MAG TPA: hypothetical protein VF629_13995 [Hymenobacter sp.]|jgi:hypothetical protein|uniref:hypothetical protein n=1 Tax=Hymenobacter sp. TaxID=1898978 RepID=UPI002EDA5C8E